MGACVPECGRVVWGSEKGNNMTTEHKTLAGAVCAVMSEVGHVQKTGSNDHHGYKYASDADLLSALQPAMAKHGLILVPSEIVRTDDAKQCNLLITYTLRHTSGETQQVQAVGCGVLAQGKGPYIAMTGCHKMAVRQSFNIPTTEYDPEKDANNTQERILGGPPVKRPPPTPTIDAGWPVTHQQLRAEIASAMKSGRWSEGEIVRALGKFGAARVTDLSGAGTVADLLPIFKLEAGAGLKALGIGGGE